MFSSLNRAEAAERFTYFLLLFSLPTQLGKHFWPDYAFVSGFRVDYLSPTLYVSDILIVLLLLLSLRHFRHMPVSAIYPGLLPYALVVCFLLLTVLSALSFSAGLYSLVKVGEMLFFGWYTARVLAIPWVKIVVASIFGVTVTFESLLALAQISANGSLGSAFYWLGERTISSLTPGAATVVLQGEVLLRPYATFSHPNVLAGFLLLGMTFILFRKQAFPSPTGTVFWGSVLLIGTIGLLATLSRVAILLWGVVLLVTTLRALTIRRPPLAPRQVAFFLLFVVACLIVFLPFLLPVVTRFTQSSLTEESFLVRLDLTAIAWQLFLGYPLLGVGLGNFLLMSAPLKSPETPLFLAVQPVHNIFLLILVETGVLGFFLWVWFLVRSFRHAVFSARVALILIILLGLVDHYFLTIQQGQMLTAFFLGACWVTPPAKRLSDYASKSHV